MMIASSICPLGMFHKHNEMHENDATLGNNENLKIMHKLLYKICLLRVGGPGPLNSLGL